MKEKIQEFNEIMMGPTQDEFFFGLVIYDDLSQGEVWGEYKDNQRFFLVDPSNQPNLVPEISQVFRDGKVVVMAGKDQIGEEFYDVIFPIYEEVEEDTPPGYKKAGIVFLVHIADYNSFVTRGLELATLNTVS